VYGIQAINAHNGWAMALAGALIVMAGLSILSFILSQLHKIIEFMENRKQSNATENVPSLKPEQVPDIDLNHDLSNLAESFPQYQTLTAELGSGFMLKDLFTVFQKKDFPHPHLTIRSLKEEGFLVAAGEGMFSWMDTK